MRRAADGTVVVPGHRGTIYAAKGSLALGRTAPSVVLVLPDGTSLDRRALSKVRRDECGHDYVERRLAAFGVSPRRRGESGEAFLDRALVEAGVVALRHGGCYRYAFRLGRTRAERAAVRIGLPATSYPKRTFRNRPVGRFERLELSLVTPTSRGQDALGCLRRAVVEAERVLDLDDLRADRGVMDVVDADDYVIGEAPAPIAVVTDNGPCSRGVTFADAFAGDDPLFRHVRTRVRSPQTTGVVERFFGTLKYEHLYRATIGDGNALAVEVNLFRHTYNTLRPHQALDERTPRAAYLAVEHCD